MTAPAPSTTVPPLFHNATTNLNHLHIGHPRLLATAVVAVIVIGAVIVAHEHKRHQLVENVLGTIASALGWRSPDYDTWAWQQTTRPGQKTRKRPRPVNLCPILYAGGRALQWKHGTIERMVARYRPTHQAFDQEKQDRIAGVLRAILGPVHVEWNHTKRLIFITRIHTQAETDARTLERLEGVFARALDAPKVTVTDHGDDKQITGFDVTYRPTNKDANREFRTAIDHTVNEKTGGEWQAQWDPACHSVRYRVRPHLPDKILHPIAVIETDRLPFASTDSGVLSWEIGEIPHALVVGKTGRGKSVVIRTIVTEALRPGRNIDVRIVDPKKLSLLALRGWPGITRFAVTNDDMASTIREVFDIVEARNTAILNGEATREQFTNRRILLVIDETWELIRRLEKKHPAIEEMLAIARTGRETGVHVLAGMQRPDAAMLSGEGRSNFGLRIALGSLDADAARMVAAERLVANKVRGRLEVIEEGERSTLAQGWWTPDPSERMNADEKACIEALRPVQQPSPVATVQPWETLSPAVLSEDSGVDEGLDEVSSAGLDRVRPTVYGRLPDDLVDLLVAERAAGDTFRAIAARHLNPETGRPLSPTIVQTYVKRRQDVQRSA